MGRAVFGVRRLGLPLRPDQLVKNRRFPPQTGDYSSPTALKRLETDGECVRELSSRATRSSG